VNGYLFLSRHRHYTTRQTFVLKASSGKEFDGYRAAAARRVSDAGGTAFVPFQCMFDRAIKHAPAKHWAGDGVHPASAGTALVVNRWGLIVLG